MKNEINSVLLCSGGMDSTTLAYWLVNSNINFIPLFIDYGQHCAQKELSCAKELLPEDKRNSIRIVDIGNIYSGSKSRLISPADLWSDNVVASDLYCPYRNVLFMAIASAFAQTNGLKYVYTAFINSNHAKEIDCSAHFFDKLGHIFSEYGGVELIMPFRNMNKLDVARIGLDLKVPIAQTYSCQVAESIPCGVCPNCVDRLDAFTCL